MPYTEINIFVCKLSTHLALICNNCILDFIIVIRYFKNKFPGFLWGSVVKNLPANARDTGSIPVWEDQ